MKRLWAGWRMLYIDQAARPEGCLFCRLARLTPGPDNLVLHRDDLMMIVMNAFPYNSGHVMVAPVAHRASPATLPTPERLAVWDGLARCEKALKKAYKPHGLNIGVNLGRTAGAGVLGHVHFHIVPRWNGDTNFMPVIAETKVLPESIDRTYARLKHALSQSVSGAGRKRRS